MPDPATANPLTSSIYNTEDGNVTGLKPPGHLAAARYYGLPSGTAYDNLGFNLGTWARGLTQTPLAKTYAKGFNHPASGFFAGAVPSLLLGAGAQALLNHFGTRNQYRNPWLTGAFSGALGGALGGNIGHTRHHFMKRSGAWRSGPQDPYQEIFAALQGADMPFSQKQEAVQAIAQLPPGDANQLARMVGGAFGAAVGALIVRFLSGRGLMRAAAGAVGGGLLGSMLGGMLGGGSPTMRGFAF